MQIERGALLRGPQQVHLLDRVAGISFLSVFFRHVKLSFPPINSTYKAQHEQIILHFEILLLFIHPIVYNIKVISDFAFN